MAQQTETGTQWDWADQLIGPLQNIVERVGEYEPDDETTDFEEMLLEPLSISGGESFSAEDHRGREILELLQNAQDAAGGLYTEDRRPPTGERAVYIGISDDGLLVANTGDSFDFSDPDRRKSLRILGHSETGEETIGQFGVGLTSIRSMGEAYEVWTKAPGQNGSLEPQNCWRVFCGPRTTMAAIASAVPDARESGKEARAYRRFQGVVAGESDIFDLTFDTESLQSVPLSADQIPYFTYPVAMQNWYESCGTGSEGPLRRRAYDLLTHGQEGETMSDSLPDQVRSLLSDAGPFTTAVFVDYEDEDWRALFEAITGHHPASSDEDSATRLEEQAWFDDGDTARVTPELLLNLGHIDHLVVERFADDDADDQSSIQDWEVFGRDRVENQDASTVPVAGRHITNGTGEDAVDVTEVAVRLKTSITHDRLQAPADAVSRLYSFWDAEFADGRRYGDYEWYRSAASGNAAVDDGDESTVDEPIDVSLLLQTEDSATDLYRPHLYYPIDGADKQFPYCIHGDFVVQQNRQSLAGSALARNCVVAAEAARLVGHLSETLATADTLDRTERAAIPWRLLPIPLNGPEDDAEWPRPRDLADQTSGQVADNEPLRALRADIYRRLRGHQNVQVVSDDGTQTSLASGMESELDVVLHHDPTVVAGIGGLYPLVRCASDDLESERVLECADSAIDASIPTAATLHALLQWLVAQDTASSPAEAGKEHGGPESDRNVPTPGLVASALDGVPTGRDAWLEQLVTGNGAEAGISEQLASQWWTVLQAWSEEIDEATDVGSAITEVPFDIGHAVLDATMTLGDAVDGFPHGETFVPAAPGPYLLPCDLLIEDQEPNESAADGRPTHVQLVRVESHESRGDHQRQVLRPESEDIDDITPSAETDFALYLLSERAFTDWGGSITKAKWGTREYGGSADLYRTLLKDVANRSTELSMPDLRFLATVYDRINLDEATADLDAVEGSYHARDQIKTLPRSRASIDSTKARVEARRVSIPATLLREDQEGTARNTRFGDQLLRYWLANHIDASDESDAFVDTPTDAEADQPSEPPIRTDGPVAMFPSIEDQDSTTESLSPSQIVTQLGMLGVSVLPGVRTLMIRGDDVHPDRRSASSWDPTTWSADDTSRLQDLQAVLESERGTAYLDLLSTPPFGPGESSDHTPNCRIKDFPQTEDPPGEELSGHDVMVTSWVWLPPGVCAEISALNFAALLEDYGDALADSILETGWSCNHGKGNIQTVDTFVPTLLNWQLRTVTGWEDIDWFYSPTIEGLWTDHDAWGLQYAILDSVNDRRTAASALPRIDPSGSPVSESVWTTLGVKRLDELNATEAALRLNALIEAAADGEVGREAVDEDADDSPPRLPGVEQIDAWQTLYGKLLGTIGTEVAERSDSMTLEKLHFLDRVPVQDKAGNWVGLSCDELDKAVYYDSIESNWEDRLGQLDHGQYLLRRPESRFIDTESFEALWRSTDASQESAQYPQIGRASTNKPDAAHLRETLADPSIKYGVLAAAPGQESLVDDRDRYDALTETLRRIDPASIEANGSETAWRVTPLDHAEGLKLENVEGAPSYAVAYDGEVVEPEEPVALADLFMALYQGGNKDSYKLALLGRDVEGKDEVRAELRATDVREFETDLRLSVALLDIDALIERGGIDIPDEKEVNDLREAIANCLRDGKPLSTETKTVLPDAVTGAVDAMCKADPETLRTLAGTLVDPSTADRIGELQTRLNADRPTESPSTHQLIALERLEETLSDNLFGGGLLGFTDLLPDSRACRVAERLHDFVAGMQRLDDRVKPDITSLDDLLDHDCSIVWADPVILDTETDALIDTRAAAVFPDDCTWFHLAWWLETADQPPEETEPAEAIFDAVGSFLGGKHDEQRVSVKAAARDSVSGWRSSSTSSTFTESSNTTLFDQIDTDVDWSGFSSGSDNDLTATLRTNDGGGGRPSIEQTTDQPRVAELTVLRDAYAALYETDASVDEIKSQLATLQADENDNYWRTDEGWRQLEKFDVETLPEPTELGQAETEFPTVAFDITDEGMVGYDVLDLTGWSVRCAGDVSASPEGVDLDPYLDARTLSPVPVEVKSVDSENPSFKFSLNQYRRAYDFVTAVEGDSAVPYVLFLVEVSEYERDGTEPRYSVEPCEVIVITCPADLRRLLPSDLSPNKNDTIIDNLILRVLRGGDLIIGESRSG